MFVGWQFICMTCEQHKVLEAFQLFEMHEAWMSTATVFMPTGFIWYLQEARQVASSSPHAHLQPSATHLQKLSRGVKTAGFPPDCVTSCSMNNNLWVLNINMTTFGLFISMGELLVTVSPDKVRHYWCMKRHTVYPNKRSLTEDFKG